MESQFLINISRFEKGVAVAEYMDLVVIATALEKEAQRSKTVRDAIERIYQAPYRLAQDRMEQEAA